MMKRKKNCLIKKVREINTERKRIRKQRKKGRKERMEVRK